MYNGSHAKANNKPRIRMNKLAILFIAVVMLIGAVVGSTVAFLVTQTDPVKTSSLTPAFPRTSKRILTAKQRKTFRSSTPATPPPMSALPML